MAREIQDNVGFLREAKGALAQLEAERAKSLRLQSEEKRLTRALASEKKAVEDEIASTVRKRKDEIALSYDREISKTQDKLKKARVRREKAKNQGVKERINNETAQLREENRQLKLQNSTTFRQNGIPGICNTKFYYALYFTKGIKEILIFLLTFLICFLALPCGIYLLIPKRAPWMLIVIYVAVILVLCGIYIMINNRTKVNHLEIMRDARKNRDMIEANKRKIRVIIKAIEKDKNESVYNLGKIDKVIKKIEKDLYQHANPKQEALEQEIVENNRMKLETLAGQLKQVTTASREMGSSLQKKTIAFTDEYGPYIGQEFMNQDKLDKLIDILNQGMASSLTEAQQIYKNVK